MEYETSNNLWRGGDKDVAVVLPKDAKTFFATFG